MRDERAYKRTILILTLLLAVLVGLSGALLVRYAAVSRYAPLAEMAKTIETNYYYYDEAAGEGALVDASLRGMIGSIGDTYAQYYTEEEYAALVSSQSGEYSGVGILVAVPDAAGARIERVYANSPMEAAGAQAGDIITAVNGEPAANLTLEAFVALFSEDPAVPDTLQLLRGAHAFEVTVYQQAVYVPYVTYEMLDGHTGYLYIEAFLGDAVSETEAAIAALLSQGMTQLVLDLRDDPGGGLTEVLDIADLFLKKDQLVVTIKSKTEREQVYRAQDDGYEFPLVVLINGNSASASELLTGALKDNGRAAVIGTQSFGKGIVQTYFKLSGHAGWVKITTDAYYTPSDTCIHGVGIAPDITVEMPEEYALLRPTEIPHAEDAQLQEALRYLNS